MARRATLDLTITTPQNHTHNQFIRNGLCAEGREAIDRRSDERIEQVMSHRVILIHSLIDDCQVRLGKVQKGASVSNRRTFIGIGD